MVVAKQHKKHMDIRVRSGGRVTLQAISWTMRVNIEFVANMEIEASIESYSNISRTTMTTVKIMECKT